MQKRQQEKSHVTTRPPPQPHLSLGKKIKILFSKCMPQENSFVAFVSMLQKINTHWLPSQTGPNSEHGGSAARNSDASSIFPPPKHIRLQLCGNMPGPGAAARTLLAPMEEAPCCGPEAFLKVHTGSLGCCQSCTLPLARFLALARDAPKLSLLTFFL